VWTKEQLSLFVACSQEHKFGSVWLLALTTGCRLGELLALRWADLELDSCKITVRRTLARINREWIESSPKTQAGERTITIPLLGNGLPLTAVSARLGHASPQITMSIYAHALKEHDAEAAELIGRAIATG
jgi:integrase